MSTASFALPLSRSSIAGTVANVLTTKSEDRKRLNGALNQLGDYAAHMVQQGAHHG
jgi:hypothetical protein